VHRSPSCGLVDDAQSWPAGLYPEAFRSCKNASRGAHAVEDNSLQQEFRPLVPNRYWAGDVTYILTSAGWRYLAVWVDLFSRRVVGWKLDEQMDAAVVIEALN